MKRRVEYDISSRISEEIQEELSREDYVSYLVWILQLLYKDLKNFLDEEGRNFGIMISYRTSMDSAFNKITYNNEELCMKTTYLFKNVFRCEFRRLVRRGLSKADALICIIRKFNDLLLENINYEYLKELRTIKKVIDKLYNNIKRYAKEDPLLCLANTVRKAEENLWVGKYNLSNYSVQQEEIEHTELTDDGVRIDEEKGIWTEEL